ncbi:MAG: tetratricopeptide repeat protein [Acidobacteriota bacterium]
MNEKRWLRLEELWDRASQLEADERDSFLRALADEEPELANELRSLLEHADSRFLERPLFDSALLAPASDSSDAIEDPWIGRRLESFELQELIGTGGMGRVYRALETGDGYQREVAVKLLRGLIQPHLERRLLAERSILARLEHPNIARFLGGGSTSEGIPFVVLEYVQGLPVTDYCRQVNASLERILDLFSQACGAVQYAHARLVVHRDLKPANLLVSHDGEPKLLDFGLAKVLEEVAGGQDQSQGQEPSSEPTETQYRALTPNYASPEQIAGQPVTIATDVYSLGVLLYELLTGERPYELLGLSPLEVQKTFESAPPEPPSQRLREQRLREQRPQSEDLPPQSHRLKVPEDLDRIVLKALRADPRERYESVAALLDDLGRFRSGRPVGARSQTWRYRSGKFLRRHRVASLLTSLLLLSLLTFAVVVTLQSQRLRDERNFAQQEQARSDEAVRFVENLFRIQDPYRQAASNDDGEEILAIQRQRLDTDLKDQPELQARLAGTLGLLHRREGFFDSARELFQLSLDQHRELFGPDHGQVAVMHYRLGELSAHQGQLDAAEHHLDLAIQSFEAQGAAFDELRAEALGHRAGVHQVRGETVPAEDALRDALRLIAEEQLPLEIKLLSELAIVLQRQGQLEEAEQLGRQALSLAEGQWRRGTNSEFAVAFSRRALGEVLRNRGSFREAEEHHKAAVEVYRRRLGDDTSTGAALNDLGIVLRARGDYPGALKAYRESSAILRTIYGEGSIHLAANEINLARGEMLWGDLPQAERHIEAALALFQQHLDLEHPTAALALKVQAELRQRQGRSTEALSIIQQARRSLESKLPAHHPYLATTRATEGSILLDLGRLQEADRSLKASLQGLTQSLGDDAPPVANVQQLLGRLALKQGDPDGAAEAFERAATLWSQSDSEHPERGWALQGLALARQLQGRQDEAEVAGAEAISILQKGIRPDHPRLLAAGEITGL